MALSEEKTRRYIRRLLLSRMRILCSHGFYGLLLMHMVYSVDERLDTAATDGVRITFGADFLEGLSDRELDFVMMHEILHVVLQHCFRRGDRDRERFNIACDIVVNSNLLLEHQMDPDSITLRQFGPSMHLAPDGKEGHLYTAEQVYAMLPEQTGSRGASGRAASSASAARQAGQKPGRTAQQPGQGQGPGQTAQQPGQESGPAARQGWDDHSRWGDQEEDEGLRDVWVKRFEEACQSVSIRDPSNERGLLPAFARRLLGELRRPQIDWRTMLNDFVQEEVADYSFTPPDRRFADSPFFLPDFNDKADRVENILFLIDTSASISDEMVTAAYSEIKGAIDQFDGRLKGWLGFFDAAVIEPVPFESVEEVCRIRPVGGGGTNFHILFEYVFRHMEEELPASIVILTDGYAPFPAKSAARGIPVLWLLNNREAEPPWGRTARITL